MTPEHEQVRIAVVLSAGGLRGAAHVGVLRQLIRRGVPIDRIVGVSAGAVIAAYYAAVGLELEEELIDDAERFRGGQLLASSGDVHVGHRFEARVGPLCEVIPERLRQLEAHGSITSVTAFVGSESSATMVETQKLGIEN